MPKDVVKYKLCGAYDWAQYLSAVLGSTLLYFDLTVKSQYPILFERGENG